MERGAARQLDRGAVLRRGMFWFVAALAATWLGPPTPPPVGAAPAVERFALVPGESSASYHAQETFLGSTRTAVGTTREVRGHILIDRSNLRGLHIGTIVIDLSKLQSDNGSRDDYLRRNTLATERFPTAEFAPSDVLGLPEAPAPGRDVPVTIRGALRLRDVTRNASFAAVLRFEDAAIIGAASTTVRLTDHGIPPPNFANLVRAGDAVRLEIRFTARPEH
jgi:polyisoprenoid-binding protein YceI